MSIAAAVATLALVAVPCVGWVLETRRRKALEAQLAARRQVVSNVIDLSSGSRSRHPSSRRVSK